MHWKMNIYILALILILNTTVFNSKGHIIRLPCLKFGNFSIILNNTALKGSIIATRYGVDETSCKIECLQDDRCKSININEEEMTCQLNAKVAEDLHDGVELVLMKGWTYKSTNYKSNTFGPNCEMHRPCPSENLCYDTCECNGYRCYKKHPGNLALLKETKQSTTFANGFSQNAVDGLSSWEYSGTQCAHTKDERMPWWKVDLKAVYYVSKVKVKNRYDCCWKRLSEFQVRIGASDDDPMANPLCSYQHDVVGRGQWKLITCNYPIWGRHVFIVLLKGGYLTLCEVEVFEQD